MSDNISRQAALDAVSYETFECYKARKAIRALPSAPTVEERPKGEWINIDTKLYRVQCSACRKWSDVVGNYCPWCGADMRGGKE